MHSYKNFFINLLFLLSSFCISCSQYLFPAFKVIDVSFDDKKIVITFSAEIEEDSVQKSISLLEDDSSIAGYFQCSGNTVLYFPVNGIQNNYDYDLTISTSCEDKNGISLLNEYHKSFTTRGEHDRPQIISVTPSNEYNINGKLEFIDIVFSESVVKESFINALDISPSFDFFLEFSINDTNVRIIPKKPLTLNSDYVITINTELEDLSRNSLIEDKKFMFFYNKIDTLPDYAVSVYNKDDSFLTDLELNENIHDIPTNCSIKFNFSHAMDLSAVSAYFYFAPTVDYKIIKDEIEGKYVQFNITNAKWNTKYDLVFLNGLPDVYGQRFEDLKVYTFTTDNELNNPPCFVKGIIQTSEWTDSTLYETINFSYLSEEKNYSNISFSDYYTAGNSRKTQAYLLFYTSTQSKGIDVHSLREGLSASSTNSCCQIVIKNVEKTDLNVIPSNVSSLFSQDITNTNRKVDIFYVVFEITNTSNSGELHFVLDSDIKDTLNNQLDRKYDLIFNK